MLQLEEIIDMHFVTRVHAMILQLINLKSESEQYYSKLFYYYLSVCYIGSYIFTFYSIEPTLYPTGA